MGAGGGLEEWAAGSGRRRPGSWSRGYLRFAFYGRVSTEDWQDLASSLVRQREQAGALVRGHGSIVAEFFDVGQSRSVAWARRPQAAVLVAQLADPGPGLEGHRDQGVRAGVLRRSVRADGPVVRALRGPAVAAGGRRAGRLQLRAGRANHDGARAIVQAGDRSYQHPGADRNGGPDAESGPVPRRPAAVRVSARGCRAAPEQGPRRLGPPRASARARPGDRTGCAWMFTQRLAGHSMAWIARALNDAGVPCPSAADPGRNPHRAGTA